MYTCIHCDNPIPDKRVEILRKTNALLTCVNCSDTQKVRGFQVNEGKADRYIQVNTPTQAKRLISLERKNNKATGGPGGNKRS